MMCHNTIATAAAGAALALLASCSGIMGGLYDEPEDGGKSGYGFVSASEAGKPGRIYIDATDYKRWIYINFASMSIDTLGVDEPEPEQWDIAVHRYDVRTNGGAACSTGATALTLPLPVAETFTPDVWTTEKIITDMSTMAEGYISYSPSWYNAVVSEWLDVDTSTMPPLYTPSGKVYVVQMADGRRAALRLADFMNAAGVKGYMTIEYIYPL